MCGGELAGGYVCVSVWGRVSGGYVCVSVWRRVSGGPVCVSVWGELAGGCVYEPCMVSVQALQNHNTNSAPNKSGCPDTQTIKEKVIISDNVVSYGSLALSSCS